MKRENLPKGASAGQPTKTRDNNVVHQVLVADGTAAITLSLWDELGELVDSGDILRLTNGCAACITGARSLMAVARRWASLHKGALHLYAGNKGKVKRVGQCACLSMRICFGSLSSYLGCGRRYNMVFTEVPNMSHYQWQPDPNNPDVPVRLAAEARTWDGLS